MRIEKITVGLLQTNCYVIHDGNECIIVDPGDDENMIISFIDTAGLTPLKIIATHCHFDHVSGVNGIKSKYDIPFYIHEDDLPILKHTSPERIFNEWGIKIPPQPEPDGFLKDGDYIKFHNSGLTVIHTPGHTPGHIVLRGDDFLISGDLLFKNGVGRTDFFGGNSELLKNSLKKILELPDDFAVYPGHGPSTTIGQERKNLAFLIGS